MPLTPNNREETFLQGIVDGQTTLTPNNRKEHWYKAIIDGSTDLVPNKRSEYWYKEIMESRGGGGSSDFSVANVTLNNASGDPLNFSWPVLYEENELGEGSPAMVFANVFVAGDETTKLLKMPLYKGGCYIEITGATYSVSGNITEMFEGSLLVTGDGNITIS